MHVHQYINPHFTSNTYLILTAKSTRVWLVDLGAFDQVIENLTEDQIVEGVLLTHYHYDHIYFINKLIEIFPFCKILASSHTSEGLYDPKLNLSFYHEDPITFKGERPLIVNDGDEIPIFEGINAKAYSTPGHNPGCITYKIGDNLFTGDSYIPNIDVVTKLKNGNKIESQQSLQKILALLLPNTIIWPGHGPMAKPLEVINHLNNLAYPTIQP